MRMIEALRRMKDLIGTIAPRDRSGARQDNVSSCHADPSMGDGVAEEEPDGPQLLHSHFFVMKPGVHAAG
ncbi:hypothetical protein ACFFP0_27675 [Rhizobium puerariae]|uniref:Uncharacterized protein n=1 Tax=Rhizobium puerariae TaxID=1585791 RepID=A0ABV6ATI6_9HYPH